MRSRRLAAIAGLAACLLQLVGYDLCAHWEGYAPGGSMHTFWAAAAIVSGPAFGLAGRTWRHGTPELQGLGPACLVAAFVAEGVSAYGHVLHQPATEGLWLAIAGGIGGLGMRGLRDWRWLLVTLPVAFVTEAAVIQLCQGRAW